MKRNAEHIMLVTLRNDLSRGGGHVGNRLLRQIRFYSHVIHMVSRVKPHFPDLADVFSLFAGTFLPKHTHRRSAKGAGRMEIIDTLEPHSRVRCMEDVSSQIGLDWRRPVPPRRQGIVARSVLTK